MGAAGRDGALGAPCKASLAERIVDGLFAALAEQTVEVPGSIMAKQAVLMYAARVSWQSVAASGEAEGPTASRRGARSSANRILTHGHRRTIREPCTLENPVKRAGD